MAEEHAREEAPQGESLNIKQTLATLSTKTLVQSAIHDIIAEEENDDNTNHNFAIFELQSRATPETLSYMIALLSSSNVYERAVAAWVLGQMQSGEREYHAFQDDAVDALIKGLERWQHDPRTLENIGIALGHRSDPRAISALVALKDHQASSVRFGIVFGLSRLTQPLAVATLLELTTDPDDKVRDWATFAFTNYLKADSPEIREAMFARLYDADIDIRSEAIEALAMRDDPRALPALLQAIADGANGSPILEAAVKLADPQLYPALIALRGKVNTWDNESLEEAIVACAPDSKPRDIGK